MDKKILVICQSPHQLEKGLYIQKVIPSAVDVVFINQKLNLSSKVLLENVNSYKSFEPLSSKIDEYDKFIFFSMVPSQQLFALIQNIRRAKKIIIAIQETHQLSMHLGVVNNLIFSVDIIFAASDLEKKTLDQLQPNAKIYSIGWLFQDGYKEFISALYQPSNLKEITNHALIIFSAPTNITASSKESFRVRKNILHFLNKKYQNLKLIIKLHPLENKSLFKEYARINCVENISFAEENQSLFSLSKNASVIVTSNETQVFIDLIEDDREFILYELGKENFISQYFRSCLDITEINGVKFYSLLKHSNNIAGFKDLYCKSEGEAINYFLEIIQQQTKEGIQDDKMEIAAWNYVYGLSSDFKKIINCESSALASNLKKIFDSQEMFDLRKLDKALNSLPKRTAITLIMMKLFVDNDKIQTSLLKDFTELMFNPHIIQYFAIDSIRFEFYLRNKGLAQCIPFESNSLLEVTKASFSKKSLIMNTLFIIEKSVKDLRSGPIRRFAYYLIDRTISSIKTLTN
ncbi:MAG: hypothetical protein VX864_00845 [Pseudomonadota bacterium]|nr:hypothetical protein [Pseudomonadota bacterium]